MLTRSILTCIILTAGVLLTGCRSGGELRQPPETAPFTTDQVAYDPGDEVVLTLRNDYEQPIGYNLCTSQLQRSVEGSWESVAEDRMCTMQLNTLDSGRVDTYSIVLPDSLGSGTYRYSTGVQGMRDPNAPPGQDQALVTNEFEVE